MTSYSFAVKRFGDYVYPYILPVVHMIRDGWFIPYENVAALKNYQATAPLPDVLTKADTALTKLSERANADG
jgi:hypothetical protein